MSMSTLPLEVHEVLEEEYRAVHHADPTSKIGYEDFEVIDRDSAKSVLLGCGVPKQDLESKSGEDVLKEFVEGKRDIKSFANSSAISSTGRRILKDRDKYTDDKRRVRRRIIDLTFVGAVKPLRDQRLSELYGKLHDTQDAPRAALCISGGVT